MKNVTEKESKNIKYMVLRLASKIVQLHAIDMQIGDFDAIFVIYALITSLMGIKSFDLFTQ